MDRSGHRWWRPWRRQVCGPRMSKFGGDRIPLQIISLIDQFMNCARGRRGCQGLVDSCGGGNRNLNWRRRATATARERRGR